MVTRAIVCEITGLVTFYLPALIVGGLFMLQAFAKHDFNVTSGFSTRAGNSLWDIRSSTWISC